jgi:hypothetical protein
MHATISLNGLGESWAAVMGFCLGKMLVVLDSWVHIKLKSFSLRHRWHGGRPA